MNIQQFVLRSINNKNNIYLKSAKLTKEKKLEFELSPDVKNAKKYISLHDAFNLCDLLSSAFKFDVIPICFFCGNDDSTVKIFYSKSNQYYVCKNCVQKKRD